MINISKNKYDVIRKKKKTKISSKMALWSIINEGYDSSVTYNLLRERIQLWRFVLYFTKPLLNAF